jgi:uncharacterized protein
MAIDTTWQRIGVRRFHNFAERAIAAGTAWVVHAPSNEATWTQVTKEIETFFTRLWRARVFTGNKPEEAFFVRCDRTTMTESDIANGRVVWMYSVALADEDLKFPVIKTATAPGTQGAHTDLCSRNG